MSLVEHDDVIKALSADTADHAFNIRVLPGRLWRNRDWLDAQMLDTLLKELPVDGIPVADQESWYFVVRERFDDLLGRPTSG